MPKFPGLPKIGVKRTNFQKSKPKQRPKAKSIVQGKKQKQVKHRETKFVPLNTTNVDIIKEYFESLSPQLFQILATGGKYLLYQFESDSEEREIFLIPSSMGKMVKDLSREVAIYSAGIHFGYMRRKRTTTGFARAFFLSYEGGEFILQLVRKEYPPILGALQFIHLTNEGEKAFLYGQSLKPEYISDDIDQIEKKKLIFVLDQEENYLGLALLMVQRSGAKSLNRSLYSEDSSRSKYFALSFLNLADAGVFFRKGD